MKQIILILAMAVAWAFPMKHNDVAAEAVAQAVAGPDVVGVVVTPAFCVVVERPAAPDPAPGTDL